MYGVCVWLPATLVEPGAVSAAGAPLTGFLHLGRHPHGTDETARRIAADLGQAHFEAPVVPDVARWQYAKLLGNLANAIEAVSGVLTSEEGLALYARVRAEGEAVLTAADIAYTGEEEQKRVRDDKIRFEPFDGSERGGGSSWQSLDRGTGTIEADYLNGEIVLLGGCTVCRPAQRAAPAAREHLRARAQGGGSLPVAELVRLADEAVAFVQEERAPRP